MEADSEDAPATGGGYRYTFVGANLSDEFQCPQCQLVPRDPHQVTCCGRILCKGCLHQLRLKDQDFLCPNCSTSLVKNYFKDINTERKIFNLFIYCTNKEKGCQWNGKVKDIEAHLSQCSHQPVECPNQCSQPIYPHQLETHLQEHCPHRTATCPHCQATDRHNIITGSAHLEICTELPVECPNKDCQEIVVQRLLQEHRENCPKETVPCPYTNIGCRVLVTREGVQSHCKQSIEEHLDQAMIHVTSLTSDMEELTFTTLQIQKRLEEVTTQQKQVNMQKLVLRLSSFEAHRNTRKVWYSPGFHSAPSGGYKLSLSVMCDGQDKGKGTHISCYIHLMSGEYDDTLEWPFQGEVTIELLNQQRDRNHHKQIIRFNEFTPDKYTQRVTRSPYGLGWGKSEFISLSELSEVPSLNRQYLMNDSVHFRISVNVASKTKPWLFGHR